MRLLWEQNSQEEDLGFLIIDARNAFNKENRMAMLWDVWHECPSGTQFILNCYYYCATQVVRDSEDGSGHFMHIKEGMTQGVYLSMIAYGIGVLSLI